MAYHDRVRRPFAVVLAVAAAGGLAHCTLLTDTGGLTGGAPAHDAAPDVDATQPPPDSGSSDGASPDGASGCAHGQGPTSIRVTVSAGSYCVDATEVSRAQYAEFLASNPDPGQQPATCAWNGSFAPAQADGGAVSLGFDPRPVAYVDWCDARAYCAWAGKRLCGAIGGGPTPVSSYANVKISQWFAACSRDGVRVFPYGSTYDPNACVSHEHIDAGEQPVGGTPTCQGGFDGLFDMSGNVEEWEDACDDAAGDAGIGMCLTRGGSVNDGMVPLYSRCDTPYKSGYERSSRNSDVGIRCCSDG